MRTPFNRETQVHTFSPKILKDDLITLKIQLKALFYRDEFEDFKEEMERARQRRGKVLVRKDWKDGVKPEKVVKFRYDD